MKILLCGGGTEGHIAPSMALAEKMKQRGDAFLFCARANGDENQKILARKYPFAPIDIQSFSSYRWSDKWQFIKKLKVALKESEKIIEDFRPDALFATGGYVSFAPLYIAKKKQIPIYIHEANAIAGTVTKHFRNVAKSIFLGLPNSEMNFTNFKNIKYVGIPVREDFYKITRSVARRHLGIKDEFVIISFGGSLGAQKLNEVCLEIMRVYSSKTDAIHIHATGKSYYEKMCGICHDFLVSKGKCRAVSYLEDMAYYLAGADVVICRAGAATISEILSTGAYPILIPSPNVKNNHQFYNARCIADITKTPVLSETQHLTGDVLQEIEYVRNHPSEATGRREKIKSLFRENCAEIILEHIHKEVFYM